MLYPSTLRDLLIRIAQAGLVQARWSDRILGETFDSRRRNRPDLDPVKLARTRDPMNRAVRDCLVVGYEPVTETLELTDPDDRHVAIRAHAQVLVTKYLRDFPSDALVAWNIEAKDPDQFVLDQIDLDPDALHHAVAAIARARTRPADVLDHLARQALPRSVNALRERLAETG